MKTQTPCEMVKRLFCCVADEGADNVPLSGVDDFPSLSLSSYGVEMPEMWNRRRSSSRSLRLL